MQAGGVEDRHRRVLLPHEEVDLGAAEEDALRPAVGEVAVIALPDPKWIECVAAAVVRKSDVGEREVLEHARSRLSGFKVPKTISFVEDLPRNSAGKLLKRVVREQMSEHETG